MTQLRCAPLTARMGRSVGGQLACVTIVVGLLLSCVPAAARDVGVPIQFDHELLRQMLLTQVFTGPDHSLPVWDDGEECSHLDLSDPRVDTDAGQIRVRSASSGRVGT